MDVVIDPAIPATGWTIHGELTDDALAALVAMLDSVECGGEEQETRDAETGAAR